MARATSSGDVMLMRSTLNCSMVGLYCARDGKT